MPEGDTIAYAARRMRPVLEGQVPDEIHTPQRRHTIDRWPQRLAGRAVTEIATHGKHLFLHFEGELVLHSHLRMTGAWGVYDDNRRPRRSMRRAWLVLRRSSAEVVEFDGPVLELLTDSRTRFDQRLAALGPDVLAAEFDYPRYLARLRADDPTRGIADALLDQRNVAGIGNIWRAEGCWE
ncbi:MAG: DNA-formamidopyrimidine glycosylase family protein, partial [Solirubrobacteraceae bacterium]